MNQYAKRVLLRYADNVSKEEYFRLCNEIKIVLNQVIEKTDYKFKAILNALESVENPENLIVPWDELDIDAQKDTLNLLQGALSDAQRFYEVGLRSLLKAYGRGDNLDDFLGQILDYEYTDLYTLAEWGA